VIPTHQVAPSCDGMGLTSHRWINLIAFFFSTLICLWLLELVDLYDIKNFLNNNIENKLVVIIFIFIYLFIYFYKYG